MLVFLTSLLVGPLLSLAQNSTAVSIYGVKPNLIMALLIAYALVEKDWWRRIAILLFSNIALMFGPTFNLQSVYWIAIMFLIVALLDYLPWNSAANTGASLIVGILLINLESLQIPVVVMEFIYTTIFL